MIRILLLAALLSGCFKPNYGFSYTNNDGNPRAEYFETMQACESFRREVQQAIHFWGYNNVGPCKRAKQ